MKKVVLSKTGGPECLEWKEGDLPDPENDQVLVDVKAVGLNWSEIMIRSGEWPLDMSEGFTPGAEGAGIVMSVGDKVTRFQAGERVGIFDVGAYLDAGQGTYSDQMLVSEKRLLKMPGQLTFEEMASIPMALLTAYDVMICHSPLPESGTVLVTASTGAVGIAAIQVARMKGLRVIATTRSRAKVEFLNSLGAEVVVADSASSLSEGLKKILGDSLIDYVFDPVYGETASQLLPMLAFNGTYVVYGMLGGFETTLDSSILFQQSKLHGYIVLRNLGEPDDLQRVWSEIYPLVDAGEITIPVSKTFPMVDVAKAHESMEQHSHFGKLVLTG